MFVFFLISILCLLQASYDVVLGSAALANPVCFAQLERLKYWTAENNSAFRAVRDNLLPVWGVRQKGGVALALSFETFSYQLKIKQNEAAWRNSWNKIKYMPAILTATDTVNWPNESEFERLYPRLGIDFMGKPDATDLKAAIGLQIGEKTPSIFYHDLKLPSSEPKIPDGPWKVGDAIVRYWHNGYSFGGRRLEGKGESRLDDGPEDCSSFIAKMLGLNPDSLSSADIRDVLVQGKKEVVVKALEQDIKPGQIIFYTGHIALSFGLTEPGKLLLLEYNRDREGKNMEGFGVREISIQQGEEQNTWFLADNKSRKVQFFTSGN